QFILHSGISVCALLTTEIHKPETTLQEKKDRLIRLMEDLDLNHEKKGATLADRIDIIVASLKEGIDQEFEMLSASGFKELVESLANTSPDVFTRLRKEFEIEEQDNL